MSQPIRNLRSHQQSAVGRSNRRALSQGSGFTLIELLVVIAIIAILAAILFPVFARARENARKATCLSNMKQMGMGIVMYAQDYDEILPYGYNYHVQRSCSGVLTRWADDIQPYVKNYGALLCPSRSPHINYGPCGRATLAQPTLLLDYVCNTAAPPNPAPNLPPGVRFGPFTNNWGNSGRPMATVDDVTGTIAVFDSKATEIQTGASGGVWYRGTDLGATPVVDVRHMDGFNVVFVDGHTKWLKHSKYGMWTCQADD